MDYGISDLQLAYRAADHMVRFPGQLSVSDLKLLLVKSGGVCCWCGKENLRGRDLTFEHLEPRNDINTMAIACSRCNFSKSGAGARSKADLPEEVIEHRKTKKHRHWEALNIEAKRFIKRAEYQRHKDTTIKAYRAENKDRITADKKRYREEKAEKIAAYQKKWDAENKDKHAAQRKAWREANPDEVKRRWSEYASQNREKLNEKARLRRAKRDSDPEARARYLEARKLKRQPKKTETIHLSAASN